MSQIHLVKAVFITNKIGFWIPVLFFYLTDVQGFTPTAVLTAIGVASLLTSLFELPTGVIADKVSRRMSLALGALFKIIAFGFFIIASNYFLLALAIIARALGSSLVSGADESLLYDNLKLQSQERTYKSHIRQLKGIHLVQVTLAVLIGSQLGSFDLVYPLIASMVGYSFGVVFSLFLRDIEMTSVGENIIQENYLSHVRNSSRVIFSKQAVLSGLSFFTLGSSVIIAFRMSNKDLYAPILENFSGDYQMIGTVISIVFLFRVLGYFVPMKLVHQLLKSELKHIATFLLYPIFLLGLIFVNDLYIAGIFVIIAVFTEGIYSPYLQQMFNDEIPSQYRSTLLSLRSLIKNIVSVLILGLFGFFVTSFGFEYGIIYLSSLALLGFVSVYPFIRNYKDRPVK